MSVSPLKVFFAASSVYLAGMLGGWDKALQGLIVFMALDLLAGMLVAIKQKRFLSILAVIGFTRKVGYLLVIAAAQTVDVYMLAEAGTPWLRTMAATWYAWSELNSFAANLSLAGVNLPPFMAEYLKREIASKESKGAKWVGGETSIRDGAPADGVTAIRGGDTR